MPVEPPCRVSIIMACRNLGRYLDDALQSARSQSLYAIEILVVDDQSTDDTRLRAQQQAATDRRVVILNGPGKGAGAARNIALERARGDWIAILDGDDFMHPKRLELLVEEAEKARLDLIADNLFVFYDHPSDRRPHLLLPTATFGQRRRIELTSYIRYNTLFSAEPPLGYLKPIIRREKLRMSGLRYDETLRIGEDYDLVARLLLGGSRFGYVPAPLYFYRRHATSTSFRLRESDVDALIAAADRFHQSILSDEMLARQASIARRRSLVTAAHFSRAVGQLKAKSWWASLRTLVANPATIPLLADSLRATVARRFWAAYMRPAAEMTASQCRALVLLRVGQNMPATLQDTLRKRALVPTMIAVPATAKVTTNMSLPKMLTQLSRNRPFSRIFCEDEGLADFVPYALSPSAGIEWDPTSSLPSPPAVQPTGASNRPVSHTPANGLADGLPR
jgi:succinoglycan biosynthesis protein ExoO